MKFERREFMSRSSLALGEYVEKLENSGFNFISSKELDFMLSECNGLSDPHASYVIRWALKKKVPGIADIAVRRLSSVLEPGIQLAILNELRSARVLSRKHLAALRDIPPLVPLHMWDIIITDIAENLHESS